MSDVGDGILRVARAVRAAESQRVAAASESLALYDADLHDRGGSAICYLKAVKAADDAYADEVQDALTAFAREVGGAL